MKRGVAIMLIAMLCCQVQAQEKKNWVSRQWNRLVSFIDEMSVSGIDTNYIAIPEKPWQIILRYNANDMLLRSSTKMSEETLISQGINGEYEWETTVSPNTSSSIGLWVGYRGYGLGYSLSLSKGQGRNFLFAATGSRFSISLRLRRFKTNDMGIRLSGFDEDGKFDWKSEGHADDPLSVHTTLVDGYYMLNGKRFSHAAAYDQSAIQLRSAGSIVVGASWFYTSLNSASDNNAILIQTMNGIGRTQIYEGSIGLGYTYNWVPTKNLLVNVIAIPQFTLYNRAKAYLYESNYDIFLKPGEITPDGKKALPVDGTWPDDFAITPKGTAEKHGSISLNFDARMSVTYQLGRYFINAYGQVNHYNHYFGDNHMKITDWSVNGSIGIRL